MTQGNSGWGKPRRGAVCRPGGLPGSPELAALKLLRGFLADAEAVRATVSEAFLRDELEGSRAFLDACGGCRVAQPTQMKARGSASSAWKSAPRSTCTGY